MTNALQGVLLVDKPKGWTSFDVVAKVRGVLAYSGVTKPKVGHAGTLDPLATGLLILLLGDYTKQASRFSKLDKTYKVVMELGKISTTGDEEGEKTVLKGQVPTKEALLAAFQGFLGEISQTPPSYSAIKVGGRRAYKLARQGKKVILEPRAVFIDSIKLESYSYPEVVFLTRVSSGTYIRSLVEDIGKALENGAYTKELCRTAVGNFNLADALNIKDLSGEQIHISLLRP